MAASTPEAVELERLVTAAIQQYHAGVSARESTSALQKPITMPTDPALVGGRGHELVVPATEYSGDGHPHPGHYPGAGGTGYDMQEGGVITLRPLAWLYHMSMMWAPHVLLVISPLHVLVMTILLAAEIHSDGDCEGCRVLNAFLPAVVVILYVCFVLSRSYRLKYGGRNFTNYLRMFIAFSVLFNVVLGFAYVYYLGRDGIGTNVQEDPGNPYWYVHMSWTTLTTVGFGDMYPRTVAMAVYVNVQMFVYFMFIVFGAISDAAAYWNENSLYTHEKVRAELNGDWMAGWRERRARHHAASAAQQAYMQPQYAYTTVQQQPQQQGAMQA